MTITLNTSDGKRVVALCSRAVAPGHPVLGAIHIACADDVATFSATDLDLAITVQLDCTGTEGRALLSAKRLADVLGRCPGDTVSLAPGESDLTVTSGRWRAKLPVIPAAEYDPYLSTEAPRGTAFGGDALLAAIGRVVLACSTDKSRELLSGLHLQPEGDGIRLVASDSYRLATRHLAASGIEDGVTVPASALHALTVAHQPGDKIELHATPNRAWLQTGRTTIATTLIVGKYPDWRMVMPGAEPTGHLTVDNPDEMADAVLRSGRLFGGDMGLVTLTLQSDVIGVRACAADEGESAEDLDAIWTGTEGLAITFRADFLAEGLRSTGGPATIAIIDDHKPAIFRAAGDADSNDLYLLMPVRRR